MKPADKTKEQLFIDFVEFSARQLRSGDIDPAYPVIKNYLEMCKVPYSRKVYFLLVYVAFYNIKSASDYFNGKSKKLSEMKYGVERRGFRGNDYVKKHLASLDGDEIMTAIRIGSWKRIQEVYERGYYTGTWSSYKFADLCKYVLGCKIEAPDLGLGGNGKNAGPIPGLSLLSQRPWEECANDLFLQKRFYNKCLLSTPGVRFRGMEELETCLCDFNSMFKGHYYTGNDIDKQQEDLAGADPHWWEARRRSFDEEFLGEHKGWNGVRKELLTRYREEGII